jgi:hypothetical protein
MTALFCPAAADWGSIADWVAGVGSVSAVVVALWLSQKGDRDRRRQERRSAEAICESAAEALRLYAELSDYFGRGYSSVELHPTQKIVAIKERAARLEEVARHLQKRQDVDVAVMSIAVDVERLTHVMADTLGYDAPPESVFHASKLRFSLLQGRSDRLRVDEELERQRYGLPRPRVVFA